MISGQTLAHHAADEGSPGIVAAAAPAAATAPLPDENWCEDCWEPAFLNV